MPYTFNLNSGYGASMAAALPMRLTGRIFVVGDSSVTDYDRISEMFGIDPDGIIRQHDTIDAAVGSCRANAGDIILVAPGHTETVSAAGGLDLDVAGIKVIGLGQGDDRPNVSFTTATGADMDVGAANIHVENILFTGDVDALTGPIDVNADDFTMVNCEVRDVTGQIVDGIIVTGDRCTIDGLYYAGATGAGGQSAIQINGTDRFTLVNSHIDGNFATAAVESVTGTNTNKKIRDCYLRTRNSNDVLLSSQTNDTGDVGPNIYGRVADNAANITGAVAANKEQFFDPIYIANNDGERGMQWNGTASTDA